MAESQLSCNEACHWETKHQFKLIDSRLKITNWIEGHKNWETTWSQVTQTNLHRTFNSRYDVLLVYEFVCLFLAFDLIHKRKSTNNSCYDVLLVCQREHPSNFLLFDFLFRSGKGKMWNIFVKIAKCICPSCQMYLLKLVNLFVQIEKCVMTFCCFALPLFNFLIRSGKDKSWNEIYLNPEIFCLFLCPLVQCFSITSLYRNAIKWNWAGASHF